ncbi:hypothetical protein [Sphingomonas sp. S-NIH.Pt15_0812]|uniref:hypothetical protein n=1 Tax=Sphingomonas sp. S-NIH.Pt15_0812 TaxID=1920129 RepID=UPI000F7E3DF1|nr:hypothetical protein [Sphingomonas sp. S-NIH.Pt15_0812]RSU51067.1 hypothetical protein BRX43_07080 [Sphingomonas sp. S-NIH.Pt15_0812]
MSVEAILACLGAIGGHDRATWKLSVVQAREIVAELAAANPHLENRPQFQSTTADEDGTDLAILATLEGGWPQFIERDKQTVGYLKCAMLHPDFGNERDMTRKQVERQMLVNEYTFPLTMDGDFNRNALMARESET